MENEALQDREHRQCDRKLDGAGIEEVLNCHVTSHEMSASLEKIINQKPLIFLSDQPS